MDCHFKEKVVLWPSFLYKGNFYTGKAPLRIAIGPPYIIDISEDEISMVVYNPHPHPPPPPPKKKKNHLYTTNAYTYWIISVTEVPFLKR